jgi:hypothetical protein
MHDRIEDRHQSHEQRGLVRMRQRAQLANDPRLDGTRHAATGTRRGRMAVDGVEQ